MDEDILDYNGAQGDSLATSLGAQVLTAADTIAAQKATIIKLQQEMEDTIGTYRRHITTLVDIIKNLQDGQVSTTLK